MLCRSPRFALLIRRSASGYGQQRETRWWYGAVLDRLLARLCRMCRSCLELPQTSSLAGLGMVVSPIIGDQFVGVAAVVLDASKPRWVLRVRPKPSSFPLPQ